MRFLIVGLGSIGRRHAQLLLNRDGVEVAALRTKKGTLSKKSDLREFFTLDDALSFKPDGVIIANPTSLHVESALPFLRQGCKVLIEKPISDTTLGAQLLREFSSGLRVAYFMRFSPLNELIKYEIVSNGVFLLNFRRSFFLPKWHPYADYRKEYTAKKSLGGGVIRTLSHEIDLACNWLGKPVKVQGIVDKISHLEMDTNDLAFFSMKMKNKARVNFHLDFLSPVNINEGEAYCEKGKYTWTMNELKFHNYETDKSEVLFKNDDEIDFIYDKQLDDFINFIKTGVSVNADYQNAIDVLDIIESLENSND